MASFSIVSDAACDLGSELRARFGVDALIYSDVLYPDGHSETVDPDWKNTTPEAYYGAMVDKKQMFKSSAPGPENVKIVFRKELDKGNDVLCITLSGGMSAIFDQCSVAAKELKEEYPARTVIVIDSRRYSTAIALPCICASECRKAGKNVEETAAIVREYLGTIHQSGWIDDLFFLARAGRLSKGTAIMGTMIGVKPIAEFNEETGMFQVIGKARGTTRAMQANVAYVKAMIEKPEEQIVFVVNSYRKELAEQFAEMIRAEIKPKEVIVNPIGQNCGANIGPGLVAVFFGGKKLSAGLADETAALAAILK